MVGKVDEILGPINQVFFTIKPTEGIVATSFKEGDKFYIGGDKLLPLDRCESVLAYILYPVTDITTLDSFQNLRLPDQRDQGGLVVEEVEPQEAVPAVDVVDVVDSHLEVDVVVEEEDVVDGVDLEGSPVAEAVEAVADSLQEDVVDSPQEAVAGIRFNLSGFVYVSFFFVDVYSLISFRFLEFIKNNEGLFALYSFCRRIYYLPHALSN
jgi:hypothetical protein